MSDLLFLNSKALVAMTLQQCALQQQLIEAQQKIIELQQKIDAMTPKDPPDEEAFWHIHSGGVMSDEAANSSDLATLHKFQKWNVNFAKKYIKPYVGHKIYGECLNQMTRGLAERITELETKNIPADSSKAQLRTLKFQARAANNKEKKLIQLALP